MVALFIDSDNAMGSSSGDVDDAFAIAAVLRSGLPVSAIAATHGNTSAPKAFANNAEIARRMGFRGPVLRGREVAAHLVANPGLRILALGPLTNIAAALDAGAQLGEVIVVGANGSSHGRWPPWWPHEFNLTKDRRAAMRVFRSPAPLTIFPLDVARRLAVSQSDLDALEGDLGAYLSRGAGRWLIRLRLLKWSGLFPVYDLAAALYAIDPLGFTMALTTADMHDNGWIGFDRGARPVTVCRALDRDLLWDRFRMLIMTYGTESNTI